MQDCTLYGYNLLHYEPLGVGLILGFLIEKGLIPELQHQFTGLLKEGGEGCKLMAKIINPTRFAHIKRLLDDVKDRIVFIYEGGYMDAHRLCLLSLPYCFDESNRSS